MAGYAKAVALAAIAVSSVLIVSIFAIPSFNSPVPAGNMAEARRIVVIAQSHEDLAFRNIKASNSGMEANSMLQVVEPFGRSMRTFNDQRINSTDEEERRSWLGKVDAQEKYMLVRLPIWLGGMENDLSAYRVFSAFDVAGQCNVIYQERRMEIQDPCSGNGYRVWDGLALHGPTTYGASGAGGSLFSSSILALPQLRLGVDSEEYIVAYKLDNTLNGDGVVGEGKRFAPEQLEQSNKQMVHAANEYAGFELPFPAIPNKHLVGLVPAVERAYIDYLFDFGHSFEDHEGIFSALYEPRPMREQHSVRVTVLMNEIEDETQAKATFNDLFGTESPECDQGCRFVIRQDDNMIARVDTEAGVDRLNVEALVWNTASTNDIMVAIEGINSSMEELLSVVASLRDHGL